MQEYGCPAKYWDYAVSYVVYTINRSPTIHSDSKTPYEMVFNIEPDISNLVPFYCKGVVHLTQEERPNKVLSVRGEDVRMLGYSDNMKNTYIVKYKSGSVKNRRDVHWDITNRYDEDNTNELDVDKVFGLEDLKKRDEEFPYWQEDSCDEEGDLRLANGIDKREIYERDFGKSSPGRVACSYRKGA